MQHNPFLLVAAVAVVLYIYVERAGETQAATFVQASWYEGPHSHMADGEVFDPRNPYSVAHPSLPFGTILQLRNPRNGKSLLVVVRDRGPYIPGRTLDLTPAGAAQLGFKKEGVAWLSMDVLEEPYYP
ncbi:MAG: septal ring lytic transglycosylase RlpA family lipoprotein [Patescibacteria group bacterium]|nr:septal ring lytic transglycosylase RlpA family lipoprotein [Patescibacteria group bacterium]